MEAELSTDIIASIAISLAISLLWLLNRGILIAFERDIAKDAAGWLRERPILIPATSVFLLPLIALYLSTPASSIIKNILPLITFIAGQSLGKYDKQKEIKNKQLEAFQSLKRKLSRFREKISLSKSIVQIELLSINSENRGFIEKRLQALDEITDEFASLDVLSSLTGNSLLSPDDHLALQKMSILIDEFNELIEERRGYRVKCRELTTESVDQYFTLLEHTDTQLLTVAESLERFMDVTSEMEMNL